ncbi:hypothetical protein ACOMHN_044419 [Nucella lapillus]
MQELDLRKSAVLKRAASLMFLILACAMSCTSQINEDIGDYKNQPRGPHSESLSTIPTTPVPAATTLPSLGQIKDYFQNHAQNGPQITNMVMRRVKQRYRPRLHWRTLQRNSALAAQRMMGVQSAGRLNQMRHHPRPYTPRSSLGRRNQQLALDDQTSASAAQAQSSGDIAGRVLDQASSASNPGKDEKVNVRINARKTARTNERRWLRLAPYRAQIRYPVLYPAQCIPTVQNNQAKANPSSETAEALAMLTQRLSKMAASMVRLEKAIVLQGAAYLLSSEKIEAKLSEQEEQITRNWKDTRETLLTVKRCCACSGQGMGWGSRRPAMPSAAWKSPRSPDQHKRDFVPPRHHRKARNPGHQNIEVRYSDSEDPSGDHETPAESVRGSNDFEKETTEYTPFWDENSQTTENVERGTAKFKQYIVINETDNNQTREVIEEVPRPKLEDYESGNKPEHTPKEGRLTTGTLDTTMPTLSHSGIYGYVAAYRLNSDQVLMHRDGHRFSGPTGVQQLAVEDERRNAETTGGHRNNPRENGIFITTDSAYKPRKTQDEESTKSFHPESRQQSPPALNLDESDSGEKAGSEDSTEKQHHYTGSEGTMKTMDGHVSETSSEKLSPDDADAASTVDLLEPLSTMASTTAQRLPFESRPVTATRSAEQETAPLQVDFISGKIQNEGMPGVTWIVRPSAPGRSRPRRSSKISRTARKPPGFSASECDLQGVLKFTFTPPAKSATSSPRRHHHHRHRRGEEEEEEEEDGVGEEEGRRRSKLMLNLEFWRPSRWVFNLGDSIANNGFSGDGLIQENDCEAQGYGNSFAIYGSDKHPNSQQKLLKIQNGFLVDNLTLIISDQTLTWNDHHGNQDTLNHPSLFALSGQSDNQGLVNYDVYLGLNRVIDGSYRSGHGLCRLSAEWLN